MFVNAKTGSQRCEHWHAMRRVVRTHSPWAELNRGSQNQEGRLRPRIGLRLRLQTISKVIALGCISAANSRACCESVAHGDIIARRSHVRLQKMCCCELSSTTRKARARPTNAIRMNNKRKVTRESERPEKNTVATNGRRVRLSFIAMLRFMMSPPSQKKNFAPT